MENSQIIWGELESAKEEIFRLIKLTLLDYGKGGELDPKLEAALEETERTQIKRQKAQKVLKTLGDA